MMSVPESVVPAVNGYQAKPTLTELAYQQIRQQILESKLPPGAVVSERMLAELLGMGKAPIRAALVRLNSDGLVSIASRQGIVISTPSIEDVIELYQMRVPLELVIVRQLAGTLREEQVDRLRANLAELMKAAESQVGYVAADFAFHRLLSELHGNKQMTRALDRIYDSLYREIGLAQKKFPEHTRDSAEEHRAVAEAIIAGDADRAEALMKSHLRFGEQFVLSRGSASHNRGASG